MQKQKSKTRISLLPQKFVLIILAVILASASVATISVSADRFDEKINSLESRNSKKQNVVE